MYLAKTPEIIKPLAGDLIWNFSRGEKVLYLTFDDGPTSAITGEILGILDDFNAKATFFCIGGNVASHSAIYQSIRARGHTVGNHTWNHMSGWQFSDYSYFKNVIECSALVASDLFRPPYGRIKRSQAKGIAKRYRIVMWDVLSGDWDQTISPGKCLENVILNAREGSIIVFHDSEKAYTNMRYALPKTLDHFANAGYSFKAIPAAQSLD